MPQHAFCLFGCVGALFAECRAKSAIARPCAPVRARKGFACKSPHIHPDDPRCLHMLSFAFGCSQMLPDAFRCSHMVSYAPRCPQMLSDSLRSWQIPSDPLKCRATVCVLPLWLRGRVVCGMSGQVGHCAPCAHVSILHANPPRSAQMLAHALICPQMLPGATRCPRMTLDALG